MTERDVATPAMLRVYNERRVVDLIAGSGPISRAQIARVSGLSKPTVSLALARLEEQRLVREAGRTSGGRGATAVLYALEPTAGYAFAFDVGRRWVRAALVDLSGHQRARRTERTRPRPAAELTRQLSAIADELVREAGVKRSAIVAATLATPGVLPEAGSRDHLELAPSLPGLERSGAIDELQAALGVNLLLENDVNAAAMAELTYGVGREIPDFVYVSLGTGVGSALVLDGQLRRGATRAAGEIGYLPVPREAAAGDCSTVEAEASAGALVRHARAIGVRATKAEDVVRGVREGDAAASAALDQIVQGLAFGVAAVCMVVDPAVVVLGGGLGLGAADLLCSRLEHRLRALLPLHTRVVPSGLSGDAVLQGALATTLIAARNAVFGAASRTHNTVPIRGLLHDVDGGPRARSLEAR